jgi:hypothetical protein
MIGPPLRDEITADTSVFASAGCGEICHTRPRGSRQTGVLE